ncbi:FliO/MopB family protein [Persephonella atlantica]|uniref:FliO/MopB family protein n=1 Tax=Persephonella atlantica TaxID=2699429 RepID=A0ABS1GHP2_9AQUI|nr:flagellar biosynthetic protein FliO [Persephonella atlantica]MBK3332463.1 FliO/MopB family protein [Persephonella atlantica]
MLEYSDIIRLFASLIIVIVIIYSLYYLVVRYGKGFIAGQRGLIKILDIKYFGKNRGIAVIEANRKYYLLSFDEQKVSIIEKWDSLEQGDKKERDEKSSAAD